MYLHVNQDHCRHLTLDVVITEVTRLIRSRGLVVVYHPSAMLLFVYCCCCLPPVIRSHCLLFSQWSVLLLDCFDNLCEAVELLEFLLAHVRVLEGREVAHKCVLVDVLILDFGEQSGERLL